mgnify:CR=1 FL=1
MPKFKKSFYIKGRDFIRAGEASINVQNLLKSMDFDPRLIRRVAICGYESEMNVVMHGGDGTLSIAIDDEKLILEIDTDGSIHPKEALKEAAKILIYHFMLFSDEKITLDTDEKFANEEFDEEVLHMRQLLKAKLVDLDLSVRALNCLKAAEVETLGDLVKFNKNDLLKFRNFGKKSLTELEELLVNMNLTFGMDTSKYKLDKD